MGLDMYLTAKRYLSSWDETDKKISKNIEAMPIGNQGMRVKEISCDAMYWRKSNAIHKWFIGLYQHELGKTIGLSVLVLL